VTAFGRAPSARPADYPARRGVITGGDAGGAAPVPEAVDPQDLLAAHRRGTDQQVEGGERPALERQRLQRARQAEPVWKESE
jgi:hypothetical protein